MKYELHTHYYPESFFEMIRDIPSEFSFDKDPTGRTIIKFRGARFFGITAPMSDPAKRLEDMDRVGIDVEVLSLFSHLFKYPAFEFGARFAIATGTSLIRGYERVPASVLFNPSQAVSR